MTGGPPLGVVLVNWNRWTDTLECLESLLRTPHAVHVVVVDNASSDGSPEQIAAWAKGELAATPAAEAMACFSQPPLPKPVPLTVLEASAARAPGAMAAAGLTLVHAGGNLGFAGGNNVGLKLLMARPDTHYYWLLNNDTIVTPGAVEALVRALTATPAPGMCGTQVRFYHQPDRVQALNGSRFSPFTGQSRSLGAGPVAPVTDPAAIAAATDYVLGASLAVSRAFLEDIGLMEERYFLYYEEVDWAVRNRRAARPFPIGFAAEALVYHKEGGSIGSSSTRGARSNLADYWLSRSRLAFTRRHYPWLLPLHWLLTLALVARRLLRGQPQKANVLLRALLARPFSP
jgi:GT2 family glycosyltransferase